MTHHLSALAALLLLASTTAFAPPAHAFQRSAFYLGFGLLSENSIGKITNTIDGKPSVLGTSSYPLFLKYDWEIGRDSYLSPSLAYTLVPRKAQGEAADITTWHLSLPYGSNMGRGGWDWSFGPGILSRSSKGKGGTVQLNNGSGMSTFGLPDRSVETKTLTLTGGVGYSKKAHRVSFDLITEGLASSRRSFNLFLAYGYNLRD